MMTDSAASIGQGQGTVFDGWFTNGSPCYGGSQNMSRSFALVAFLTAAAAGGLLPCPARAQSASPLAGVWTLNRSLSELPREIGFNPSWMPPPPGDGQSARSTGG